MATTMATTHAVLDDQHLYMCQVVDGQRRMRRVPISTPKSIGNVYQLAREQKITHVWSLPGSMVDRQDEDYYHTVPDGYDVFVAREDKKNQSSPATSFRVRKPGTYGDIYVGFPARGRWQWDNIEKPLDILSGVMYLEQVLGTVVQWSPNHMGLALVKKLYSDAKKQTWVRESEIDLTTLPFSSAAADVLWARPLTITDVGKWIHHYDKNSAYLSACQGVSVGCGTPIHRSEPDVITPDLPGVYRVSFTTTDATWDEACLPPVIETEWITQDVLKFARAHAQYNVVVHEAWQFEESHQLLRQWADDLWKARAKLKDASAEFPHEAGRLNAYYSIKEVALIGVGQFATGKYAHQFLRPNWWADVVGKARTSLLYNLTHFEDALTTPFLVYSDGLWFASDHEKPESAVPGILKRAGQLGGYKHVYSAMCTQEMVEKSQSLSQNPSKFVSYLHRCAGYR